MLQKTGQFQELCHLIHKRHAFKSYRDKLGSTVLARALFRRRSSFFHGGMNSSLLVAIFIVEAAVSGLSTSGLMRVAQSERLLHKGRFDDKTDDGIAVVV